MKTFSKPKIEYNIFIPLLLFLIISVISISSAEQLLPGINNYALKQLIWFLIGFGLVFLILKFNNSFFITYSWFFYTLGVLSLLFLLLFGKPINNAKCWIIIFNKLSIQPSEFMKIFLILFLAKTITEHNKKVIIPKTKDDLLLFFKIIIITFIPAFLTFLQPDTGIVFTYLIIMIIMLIISGIKLRILVFFGIITLTLSSIFFWLFFYSKTLFINIFGTSFLYRIDRLIDWQSGSGMQLNNALTAIGSSGLFGFGFKNTPIYFPEPHTDFIFSVFPCNFGLIGSVSLIMLIIYFNLKLINLALKNNKTIYKYIIAGFLGMLLYQQLQSIGMNIGLFPITGITFPFISYGGSSLLSYMMMIGIILSGKNKTKKYYF